MPKVAEWVCGACRSTAPPLKQFQLLRDPDTLVIQLKRWNAESNVLKHAVVPDRQLFAEGSEYSLKSIVCFIGQTIRAGHYTARIHHPTASAEFWYYNNTTRRIATPQELETEGLKARNSSPAERSYILIYDRCIVNSPINFKLI